MQISSTLLISEASIDFIGMNIIVFHAFTNCSLNILMYQHSNVYL
jgi:hypothetical protein